MYQIRSYMDCLVVTNQIEMIRFAMGQYTQLFCKVRLATSWNIYNSFNKVN